MNISEPFIRRPVATTLLTAAIAIAGAIAFTVLPVSPLPQIDFPTISVQAGLPGASAQIMASSVATPLERQLGHIAGITEMTSSSQLGNTSITLQFDLSRNIDGAARDVEAAINAARTYLPANLPANPSYRKTNPADAPIMILGLTSDKYDKEKLYDEASTVMMQKLSQIQGVGQVVVGGASLPSVRVDVNPDATEQLRPDVRQRAFGFERAKFRSAKGQLSDGNLTADILDNDQISQAAQYKPLDCWLPQRPSRSTVRCRHSHGLSTEHSQRGIFERNSFGHRDHLPPTRREYHSDEQLIRSQLPFLQAVIPQGIQTHDRSRSDDDHQRFHCERRTDSDHLRAAGDPGGVRVSAKLALDTDPDRCRAGFADRNFRGDVCVWL